MKTYIRTYPVKETATHFIVKGVTYKQMTGEITHKITKKNRTNPKFYGVYNHNETTELGELVF